MYTCERCKFWERFTDKSGARFHGLRAGKCSSEKFIALWGREGYNVDFCTGESFGCIHWKQKS